jgi:biopolymer transport protein ExbD
MKIKRRAKASTEIPASSMSDIAFLLIIFFMLTTVFSQEAGLKYELPDSVNEVELSKKNIEITVFANGSIQIDGQERPFEEIKTTVQTMKLIRPDVFVVIKVEPTAPYKYLVDTIDQVLIGGVEKIAFQSTEETLTDFDKEFQLPQN